MTHRLRQKDEKKEFDKEKKEITPRDTRGQEVPPRHQPRKRRRKEKKEEKKKEGKKRKTQGVGEGREIAVKERSPNGNSQGTIVLTPPWVTMRVMKF